jgi:hypothetical protein
MRYEKAKTWSAALVRGGKMLRGEPWTKEDEEAARAYLSPLGRFALDGIGKVPVRLAARLRDAYKARHRERTRTDRT